MSKEKEEYMDNKEVEAVAEKILEKHKAAFEELVKIESKEDHLEIGNKIFKDMSLDETFDNAKEHWEDKE